MVWYTVLHACGIGAGVYILLLSRQLVSIKRWYDISFLQGAGLIAWSFAHLMGNQPESLMRIVSSPFDILFYLFFLMSLHVFPLAPHIYYDQWKSILDSLTFLAIYAATAHTIVLSPEHRVLMLTFLHVLTGMLLLVPWTTVFLATRQIAGKQMENKTEMLVSTLLIILLATLEPFLPPAFLAIAGIPALIVLIRAHLRFPRLRTKGEVMNEHSYLHEQLQFSILDSNAMQVLLLLEVVAMLTWTDSLVYLSGIGIATAITVLRLYLTKQRNQSLIRQTLGTAGSLEKKFSEQMEQIQKKNYQLSHMLGVKQTYEKLLLASNEQSLREVSYENLQQVIEELIDVWFANMDNLVYLSLSLESRDGVVYYEVVRGDEEHSYAKRVISERIVIDEQQDSPLVPRYVVLMAKSTTEDGEELLLEQSFFQLLTVNVRGLILRCLQENQLIELRLMEQEMELAQRIQRMLTPSARLELPKLQAEAIFLPYTYIGGDYVDYLTLNDRYTCFVVADVSGHGLPASLMTTGIRSALRAVIQTCWEPDVILHRLNALLYEDLIKTRSFITMLVAVYDAREHCLMLSRAGHPQPMYLTEAGASLLPCCGGVGLGLLPDSQYERETVSLVENGMLIAYTDGLLDMDRKDSNRYLQTWLDYYSQLIDSGLMSNEHDSIAIVENFIWTKTREVMQSDDISLLILRFQTGTEQEAVIDDVV
ncbi:SpoIIE family protein phosphatase [Brevibacillus ruminantium]|uniref:SpoIIE family protein phosphatase n=1 Tax=Brevibacillus ruminantium TaxID=2950604 RepID=A0ABY4WAH2_9BACL|nr:SpoIIE family protein phosphatase [Brevibacillus ruminantium]USG64145.1 SpoIIE family protein phosphatase [Brevibacillus ruminantium]